MSKLRGRLLQIYAAFSENLNFSYLCKFCSFDLDSIPTSYQSLGTIGELYRIEGGKYSGLGNLTYTLVLRLTRYKVRHSRCCPRKEYKLYIGYFFHSLPQSKGDLISECFSLWLKSQKQRCQTSVLRTIHLKRRGCRVIWHFLLGSKRKNFPRFSDLLAHEVFYL